MSADEQHFLAIRYLKLVSWLSGNADRSLTILLDSFISPKSPCSILDNSLKSIYLSAPLWKYYHPLVKEMNRLLILGSRWRMHMTL